MLFPCILVHIQCTLVHIQWTLVQPQWLPVLFLWLPGGYGKFLYCLHWISVLLHGISVLFLSVLVQQQGLPVLSNCISDAISLYSYNHCLYCYSGNLLSSSGSLYKYRGFLVFSLAFWYSYVTYPLPFIVHRITLQLQGTSKMVPLEACTAALNLFLLLWNLVQPQ